MMPDRAVDSPITVDSADAQVVGYFNAPDLTRGLCAALIEALRSGVPVHRLPGQAVFTSAHVHHVIDVGEQRRKDLTFTIADAERRAVRAAKLSLSEDVDDEEAETYQKVAREARREATRARAALKDLDSAPLRVLDGPFDVRTDVWLPAIAALADGPGRISQAEFQALQMVVPQFQLRYADGRWAGKAIVRVNTSEGVAELGPITWDAGRGGNGSAGLAMTAGQNVPRARHSRRETKAVLTRTGRMTEAAVATAVNSVFPQLPMVLAHRLADEPLPDWVSAEWRAEPFATMLVDRYCDPVFRWLGQGKYTQTSPLRQLVVSYAAEQGHFDGAHLGKALSLDRHATGDVRRLAMVAVGPASREIRPWQPSVRLVTDHRNTGLREFAAIVCHCGEPAAHVVRVPEVASDLLCPNLHAPGAEVLGAPSGVVFPQEYVSIGMPTPEARAIVDGRRDVQVVMRARRHREVLAHLTGAEDGATSDQISDALGMKRGSLSVPLRRLEQAGIVANDGARPAVWTPTAIGRGVIRDLLPDE